MEAPIMERIKPEEDCLITYDGGKKRILNNVSGFAIPGELVAIMGASGGGKTSLLNILASRAYVSGNSKISGEIRINNRVLSKKDFGKVGAFV